MEKMLEKMKGENEYGENNNGENNNGSTQRNHNTTQPQHGARDVRQIMRGVGRGLRPPRGNGANPGIQFWYNEKRWRSTKKLAQAFLPHLNKPPTDTDSAEKMVTAIQAQIKTWVREHPFEPPFNEIWVYNDDDGNDDDGNVHHHL